MVRLRLLPFLLALTSVLLVQGASAQMRPRDPDAPSARPRPHWQPIPDQVTPDPGPVKVPRVIELRYEQAASILRQRGLVPVANRTDGIVRTQSEPDGKKVPRGTRVTLRVVPSRAPSPPTPPPTPTPTPPSPSPPPQPDINQVEVPPLRDLTLAGAEQRLAGRSLRLGEVVKRRVPGVRPGVIIGQDPVPGALVRIRSKVHVELADRSGHPPPPAILLLLLIICGVGGAAFLIYIFQTRSKPHPPPPKPRFEAKAGEATQKIVADRAIVETALRLKVVKDKGEQELEAEDVIILKKDERHD